ncbi:flagellar motor switch phosphatase FliY [Pelotomaculum terephthalicicum JT]|uniref:flagellar motor switch phosphatase FliY n=1 Tax=Pelotomaculum terephthalicicum TaxID=206393 RepID=UPI0009D31991|nr:flagellar motor switch phosphatase FliY [Pelotomaculum terephthalicicum]MCG9968062.1 flagellar motor switch phosphatase FliY [Pelotomaculum terephthalicicum JT]OPY63989.1 MAG: CheY-P phosphatase CheC [Pelotomaculum sp. PtaU1.Bin065]
MSEELLTQKEIDELFNRYSEKPIQEEAEELLTMQELDTIGEIGNICMGTSATTLSELLNKEVTIGYPQTIVCRQEEVFKAFSTPYLIIEVCFKSGLRGFNVLVITEEDIALISDIMMGGVGEIQHPIKLTEIEISAATEVMNQMIGAAATAMSNIFGVAVDIEPPRTIMVSDLSNADHSPLMTDKPVVVARFEVKIGNLFKTTFMQITDVDTARDEAYFLLMKAGLFDVPDEQAGSSVSAEPLAFQELPNLAGVLAVPSEVSFTLGRLRWTMEDVARLYIGGEINIPFPSGQVELEINGLTVAKGKMLQNGKVQITQICKPV